MLDRWFISRAEKLEPMKYGILALYNALQSCIGAIAVMKILQGGGNVFLLAICTGLTMASNSVFITQESTKLCLILFYISIIVNNSILVFYALITFL
jgi:hypothetical protein